MHNLRYVAQSALVLELAALAILSISMSLVASLDFNGTVRGSDGHGSSRVAVATIWVGYTVIVVVGVAALWALHALKHRPLSRKRMARIGVALLPYVVLHCCLILRFTYGMLSPGRSANEVVWFAMVIALASLFLLAVVATILWPPPPPRHQREIPVPAR